MDMTTFTTITGADMVAAAAELGPDISPHSARHDDEGSFVSEGYDLLRGTGYLAAAVPAELGGGGATTAEVAWAQHELARHCSATALASSMHHHVVLTQAWRFRRGLPGAEGMLRKVADGLVVASTGGGDFTVPTGTARRVDGGWEVTATKGFVSGAPAAGVAATWAITDEGEAIGFGASFADPNVRILETWDAPGMRGTASHTLVMDQMFVPEASVTARRAPGEFAPVLAIVVAKALPVIAATYLGVAQSARDSVVGRVSGTPAADDPGARRRIGLMDHHLRRARWTLEGAMGELGEDPEPSPATLGTGTMAKRSAIEDARAVGELAMDVLGGRAYRHGDPVERAWRDLRAGPYHPLDHELTLRVLGDLALDRPISLR